MGGASDGGGGRCWGCSKVEEEEEVKRPLGKH